jgi:hypothetical protein
MWHKQAKAWETMLHSYHMMKVRFRSPPFTSDPNVIITQGKYSKVITYVHDPTQRHKQKEHVGNARAGLPFVYRLARFSSLPSIDLGTVIQSRT